MNRDILVVGAGVIGCAVTYELARRGAPVELVDARPAGQGATQASAGILAPYIEARETSPLLPLTVGSLDLYDTFISRVSTGRFSQMWVFTSSSTRASVGSPTGP